MRRFRPPCRRSDCSSSTEGWGPLCKFLGKEVPDEPFLFVNETEDLNKARRVMVIVSHAWLPGHEGHGVPVAVGAMRKRSRQRTAGEHQSMFASVLSLWLVRVGCGCVLHTAFRVTFDIVH